MQRLLAKAWMKGKDNFCIPMASYPT